MAYEKTVAIVGGDLRQAHLANTLIERHNEYQVCGMFLDNGVKLSHQIHKTNDIKQTLPVCDIVILPLPLLDMNGLVNTPQSADSVTVEECLSHIRTDAVILAGMVSDEVHALANLRGIEIIDYFKREEFAVLNSIPAAF